MHEGNGALIHLLLIMILILDHIDIDKIAHIRAGIPTHVIRVDVDFAQVADHVGLVGGVDLGARSRGCEVRGGVVVVGAVGVVAVVAAAVGVGEIAGGEGEGVGGLERAVVVHADEEAGGGCWEGLGAVFDYFHYDLGFWVGLGSAFVVSLFNSLLGFCFFFF